METSHIYIQINDTCNLEPETRSGLGSLTTKDEVAVFAKMNFGVF